MSSTLRRGFWEFEFRTRCGPGSNSLERFTSATQALLFLRGFHGDPRSSFVFRGLLQERAGRAHCRTWTELEVLEELARWLVHGKLGVASWRRPVMASVIPQEEPRPAQVPFAPRARPVPRRKPKPAPPPPSPDLARQVDTLLVAAREGIPLCEECTSKSSVPAPQPPPGPDPVRQAETLIWAASAGTAFCEECTKKRVEESGGRT